MAAGGGGGTGAVAVVGGAGCCDVPPPFATGEAGGQGDGEGDAGGAQAGGTVPPATSAVWAATGESPAVEGAASQADAAEIHRFLTTLAAGVQRSLSDNSREPNGPEER